MFEKEKEILGIKSITLKNVKQAFREKAKETHPDKNDGKSNDFIIIKSAYDDLINYLKEKKEYKVYISIDNLLNKKEIVIDNIKFVLNPNKINDRKTKLKFKYNDKIYTIIVMITDKDILFHKGKIYREIKKAE